MSRLLAVLAALVLLGLTAPPADAAARIRLTASDTTPVVGQQVTLSAKVTGRPARVVFQERTGSGWRAIGADRTDRHGRASVRVRFRRAGDVTVRAVAGKAADTLRLRVQKAPTTVTAAVPAGPWQVGAQVAIEVRVGPAQAGRRVWLERRRTDTWVRATATVTTLSGGTVSIRWTPPAVGTETLRVVVDPNATHHGATSATVAREVRDGATGGFVFGGGLESTHEVHDAPGHQDQLFMSCLGSVPPTSGPVPSFAAALASSTTQPGR